MNSSSKGVASPPITVLLAVHNGMPYLKQAIESLRSQTFTDFEVLVLDDRSTDDSALYAQSIDDPRFMVLRLDRSGLAASLNRGIDESSARYIVRMDADDVALPDRIARQYAYMEQHTGCVLAGCDFERIDLSGRVIGGYAGVTTDSALRFQLMFTTPFLHPGTIFRREAVLRAGKYDTTFSVTQDYELWSRLAFEGTIGNVPAVLMKYRTNEHGASATNRALQVLNGSRAAAAFAERLGIGLSAPEWFSLHRFLTIGEYCDQTRPGPLVQTFLTAERHFARRCATCIQEYERIRDEFRSKLRWRLAEVTGTRTRRSGTRWEWGRAYLTLRLGGSSWVRPRSGQRS